MTTATEHTNGTKKSHIIFPTSGVWSHVITNVQFALRILAESPSTYITILGISDNADMTKLENIFNAFGAIRAEQVIKQYSDLPGSVTDRIQVLQTAEGKGSDPREGGKWEMPAVKMQPLMTISGFESAWLDFAGPSMGKGMGSKWHIPPSLILYDLNAMDIGVIIDSIAKSHGTPVVPALVSSGIPPTAWLRVMATDDKYGGISGAFGLRERFEKLRAEGVDDLTAAGRALHNETGRLIKTEDLPPLYDYEFRPQSTAGQWLPIFIDVLEKANDAKCCITGSIDCGTPEFEPWATKEYRKFMQERRKKYFPIGYGLTREIFESQHPAKRTKEGRFTVDEQKIIDWLDQMQAKHGARSVAYICFGSIVWPSERPELVELLVDGLLKADPPIPFLFSVSTMAKPAAIPEGVKERAEKSGLAMFADWVPQMSVLQHEAIRFFVSHCGAGSMIESSFAGVPIIAVPFVNDETFIATQLVQRGSAIQLHQLNSGMRGRPLGNGGIVTEDPKDILAEMRNAYATYHDPAKYEEYCRNARNLGKLFEDSVRQGESKKAMQEFVATYLS